MQDGRPHRNGVMDTPDASATLPMTNVGIAAVATAGDLGPLVAVADYANANPAVGDHYDRFLVGTVWEDLDGDTYYDPGEGKGGVIVTTDTADWFAVTAPGGGYAIPILDPGPMQVTFSGGGLPTHSRRRHGRRRPACSSTTRCRSRARWRAARSRCWRSARCAHAGGRTSTRRPSIASRPAAKSRIASGTSRRSTSCTRAASDSGVSSSSTGTASCRMIGPVS